MIKTVELIVALFLMICCFFAGVKYADDIKSHASWLFESKEEEVELPDLSTETEVEVTAPVEGEVATHSQVDPQAQPAADVPMDDIDTSAKPAQSK